MKEAFLKSTLLSAFVNLLVSGTSQAELLVYYPFDIESGSVVDNQGTQGNGALVGGGIYGAGKDAIFGQAFYGNRTGANDGYVQTGLSGTALGFGPASVYTAMAWVKWDGESGSVDHMVFGQEDGPGNASQLHHGIRADSESNAHYGGWGNDLADAGIVAEDTWTHMTWQYDGVDKVVFINGVESARGAGGTMAGHALPVIVGGHGRDAADPAGQSFNGALDEVRIYNEVLTPEQIMIAMRPSLAPDGDGDGLSDNDEVTVYFTDPNDADSDDDGLADGVEVANRLDPNSGVGDDGADGDPDMDGLSNRDELEVHFTNPQSADSDSDGLDDKEEIETTLTDPKDSDSDNDSLTDGAEVNEHMTNPNLGDSDNDGFTDPKEIELGSDPNDSSSVPSLNLPEPLLYYSFEVEDALTVENTGTLETAGVVAGGVTYGESKDATFGQAFYGNRTGANDAYIQTGFAGTDLGFGPDSVYTAMAWVKWDGESGSVDHMVFGQEDGPGNASQLHHGIRADGESNAHYGGWGNDLADAGTVVEETWTHMAWQYDGTDKVVFINGEETARGAGGTMAGHALPVIVGGHGRDAADPAGQSFNGAIDEVRIYGVVLDEVQIQAAMIPNAGSGPKGLEVTDIRVDQDNKTFTLSFNSRPGRTYSLLWTPDMADRMDYDELDDNVQAAESGDSTTITLPIPDQVGGEIPSRVFLFLREN